MAVTGFDPLQAAIAKIVVEYPFFLWEVERSVSALQVEVHCDALTLDRPTMTYSKHRQVGIFSQEQLTQTDPFHMEQIIYRGLRNMARKAYGELRREGFKDPVPVFIKDK